MEISRFPRELRRKKAARDGVALFVCPYFQDINFGVNYRQVCCECRGGCRQARQYGFHVRCEEARIEKLPVSRPGGPGTVHTHW